MKFRNVRLRDRNPACTVCGDNPTLTDVSKFSYDNFCQVSCNKYALIKIPTENNITVTEFEAIYQESIKKHQNDKYILIDVRGAVQYNIVSLEGSVNFPLPQMIKEPNEVLKLIENKEKVFIMCRRGNASKEATEFLMTKCNLKNVINVQGGITEYITNVDNNLPLY